MKKYIISMVMAVLAFIAILPLKAIAAQSAIDVTYNEGGTASLKLSLPNAAQEGISTLSLNLALETEGISGDTQKVIAGIEFADGIRQNAKVQTSRSWQGTTLNIYIAGTTPLFTASEGGDILDVGTVYVRGGEQGENLAFRINLTDSTLKVVRGRTTVEITEEDLEAGSESEPGNPGDSSGNGPGNSGDSSGNGPGNSGDISDDGSLEIDAVKAELQAMIERAEAIPEGERSADLQRAIDEAKRVFADPGASLEELKTALTNLENALALYESNKNSGINTSDSGRDQSQQNQRKNGSKVQGVKTGDGNLPFLYVIAAVLSAGVIGAGICRRRRCW